MELPDQPESASVSDSDDYNIRTPTATSENVTAALEEDHDLRSWVPSDGSTVIIRSVSCGNVITLLDGHIVLAPLGGRGSIYWTCVESEGWFGFQNRVTNKFLSHGRDARLECSAEQNQKWRHFTITPVTKGGYILQMLDWWTLRSIVINAENGLQRLGRTGNKLSEGIIWEFIRV
ncbi:hypothetical protein P154DRAFT_134931 [Amniculicola lignicola CBS 123094]|uniref:Ricin B lectin domain-containing protein n=1 Tax=Amniculicola lignicola CBS 123094 TaxID=1392246 RepID=A0A6A5WUE2_9PLEO|nr:hypothetical protein P154DRAFT_134931 [Amniculicola lignicola CBS 123094]